MGDELSRVAVLRSYLFGYSLGIIWTIDIFIALPNAIERLVHAWHFLTSSFSDFHAPDVVISFFAVACGILIPYSIGLLGSAFGAAFTEPLKQWIHTHELHDFSELIEPVEPIASKRLEKVFGFAVKPKALRAVEFIFLHEQDCNSAVRLEALQEETGFRRSLAFAFLIMVVASLVRFGPESLVARGCTLISAVAIFVAHAAIEHKKWDEIRMLLNYAVVMATNPRDSEQPESGETRRE
jgi:hypothetical protein